MLDCGCMGSQDNIGMDEESILDCCLRKPESKENSFSLKHTCLEV